MKKAFVIIPNLLIIGFILVFIVQYANFRVEENNQNVIMLEMMAEDTAYSMHD